jgi:hypothetical protein
MGIQNDKQSIILATLDAQPLPSTFSAGLVLPAFEFT